MKTGWVKYGLDWYYFGSDGKAAKGWTSIKNKWYYFNDSGVMYTGWLYLDDDRYLLDENGVMQTGWYHYFGNIGWSYGETWMYLESSGKAATGWKTIDGKKYYFDEDGYMANTFGYKIGDDYYCFDKNGNILTGWQSILYVSGSEKTTYWMYCKSDGKAAVGWQQINGKWYYFYLKTSQYSYVYPNYPYMFTGELDIRNDDETWDHYIFGENGVMLTGWQQGEYGRNYYLSNGKRADGWTKINGKWYFFEDYLYYAYMMSDQVREINGKYYYFNSNGVMQTGWIKKNNYYMYATSGGVLFKEQWKKIDGYWYYFDSDCHMVTGIYRLKNKVYQFDSNGRCLNP